ncbi:MAG: PAC2 family protein, partial [Actinobacteria bacterium]|nr:PAC2 family protein [Actinomycetota bacterium]
MFERVGDVDLDEPVLVMGMEGWIDAGLGGGAAMATLVEQVPNQVIARFDTDLLLDQRARRPVLRIVDGVTSPLKWPDIELRAGEDRAGKSVLLLVGPEPDMQWKSFT